MKSYFPIVILVFFFSSFNADKACEYVGSNINFAKKQTKKALAVEDINLAHYHTYKALNAIEKSKYQLKECGCEYATKNVIEGLKNLKSAIKETSLNDTRILLDKALKNIIIGLEVLQEHEFHINGYSGNEFVMNTIAHKNERTSFKEQEKSGLEKTIDASLEEYRKSLDKIIATVNCKEARAFVESIYLHCEQQLMRPHLTEGKKYYNLRTKEITEEALKKLDVCN